MPRYVILEHDYPSVHWDLMLESGEVLRTWRLTAVPQPGGQAVTATATFDHRPMYLDYEGPIRGNRGHVVRWDHGMFTWQKMESDRLAVELDGVRLRGVMVLERTSHSEWALTFTGEAKRQQHGRNR
jgi:hypothetical protein